MDETGSKVCHSRTFFPPLGFGRITLGLKRESRRKLTDPDPFDMAQGRGEHSRTTIKAFGVTNVGVS
jgi:hypothetical protein